MVVKNIVKKNAYHDSATLMLITNQISGSLGADNVAVMMGTDMNRDILSESGLLSADGRAATGNDLIFAVKAANEAEADTVLAQAEQALKDRAAAAGSSVGESVVRTLDGALRARTDANIAVVSIPGQYARAEVTKALEAGLHVLLFSDNVSLEDEIALKDLALSKGLLMMGPDCGTAIVNGTPLAFANALTRGDIGVVAAAGTGLQEVTVLISRNGGGVSQGLGTGGRDVKEAVGGRMMLFGLDALEADPATKVIVIVSKPPHKSVLAKLTDRLAGISKPVVACFLGADANLVSGKNVTAVATLEDAALQAVALSNKGAFKPSAFGADSAQIESRIAAERAKFKAGQKYVRGLYTGGTLCYESILLLSAKLNGLYSNTPVKPEQELADAKQPKQHTLIDLGEDEFTRGKPHPMIEPSLRNPWLVKQAADPEVAVLLLDVVLGYGSHPDPAGVVAQAITEAKQKAAADGRYLSVVASVCGTEQDPQGFGKAREVLEAAGTMVLESNAQAARAALLLVGGTL